MLALVVRGAYAEGLTPLSWSEHRTTDNFADTSTTTLVADQTASSGGKFVVSLACAVDTVQISFEYHGDGTGAKGFVLQGTGGTVHILYRLDSGSAEETISSTGYNNVAEIVFKYPIQNFDDGGLLGALVRPTFEAIGPQPLSAMLRAKLVRFQLPLDSGLNEVIAIDPHNSVLANFLEKCNISGEKYEQMDKNSSIDAHKRAIEDSHVPGYTVATTGHVFGPCLHYIDIATKIVPDASKSGGYSMSCADLVVDGRLFIEKVLKAPDGLDVWYLVNGRGNGQGGHQFEGWVTGDEWREFEVSNFHAVDPTQLPPTPEEIRAGNEKKIEDMQNIQAALAEWKAFILKDCDERQSSFNQFVQKENDCARNSANLEERRACLRQVKLVPAACSNWNPSSHQPVGGWNSMDDRLLRDIRHGQTVGTYNPAL